MQINKLSGTIISAAIKVHKELGPGLLESVYQKCLVYELEKSGLNIQTEIPMAFKYKDRFFHNGFRVDILVEEKIIVELKSVEQILPVHKKQLLTYLKLADKPLGLLTNFNQALIKDGITRIANNL